jgi:predicted O-methyltransferase YrrM
VSVERIEQVRERLVADGRLFPVAIGREEGLALRDCVRREGASRTLEAGLGHAVSTLFILEGSVANGGDVGHVACDPYQFTALPGHLTRYEGIGLERLEEAGVRDLVEFHEQESQLVFPRLLAEGRTFDLAFLDANHRFEGVFLDLIYSGRLLKEGGIVFADDTQLPGVRRAVDFCLANLGWTLEDEGAEAGAHEWLVLRTGSHDVYLRPFFEFVDF